MVSDSRAGDLQASAFTLCSVLSEYMGESILALAGVLLAVLESGDGAVAFCDDLEQMLDLLVLDLQFGVLPPKLGVEGIVRALEALE